MLFGAPDAVDALPSTTVLDTPVTSVSLPILSGGGGDFPDLVVEDKIGALGRRGIK